MRFLFLFFSLSLFATVNEPFHWEYISGYRNDRLHWHLQTGGFGFLNYSEINQNVQFWENGLIIKTIHRDLAFMLRGSYGAFGKGNVLQRYSNLSFATNEPLFYFDTKGWAADTSGYFGYAVNLTADRTYKAILIPLVGCSAHFEHIHRMHSHPNPFESTDTVNGGFYSMSSSLPKSLHLTWYGVFLGSNFQIEPGQRLVFSGGYSYHWLTTRFLTQYKTIVSLFNPELITKEQNNFFLKTKGNGNLGQTGWAAIDYLISRYWRSGMGLQIHYYTTKLFETTLKETITALAPYIEKRESIIPQKLKIRWTSVGGWLMLGRVF